MATNTPDEEKAILLGLQQGNHAAFTHIYQQYRDKLIANLYRILKDRDTVEELVQDLFTNLWNAREHIDPEKPIKAYLYRIAANLAKNTFRKAYYDQRLRAAMVSAGNLSYTHVEEDVFRQEEKELVNQLLDKLPPQRRRVYRLCKLEGHSYREVSQQLGISEATVNDHIIKANAFFKRLKADPMAVIAFASLLTYALLHG